MTLAIITCPLPASSDWFRVEHTCQATESTRGIEHFLIPGTSHFLFPPVYDQI